jgi:TPR repeat protein
MKTAFSAFLAIGFLLMTGCGESQLEKRARLEEESTAAEPLTLEQRAVAGDAVAQYNLGVMYYEGQGMEQDFKDAAKWFRKASEQGNPGAQINLGLMYLRGKGIMEDDKEAAKWFRKAAEQGIADAQLYLGLMYGSGEGVPEDLKEAAEWFRKAAEQGNADAQFNLGFMYGKGDGVLQDDVTAYAWWDISAAKGQEEAKKFKDLAAKELTAEVIAKAEALVKEMVKKNPKLLKKKE